MKTFIIILTLIILMIICYNINKHIIKLNLKRGNPYNWSLVTQNLIISILIFPSLIYWMIVILYSMPEFPEKPPKWL